MSTPPISDPTPAVLAVCEDEELTGGMPVDTALTLPSTASKIVCSFPTSVDTMSSVVSPSSGLFPLLLDLLPLYSKFELWKMKHETKSQYPGLMNLLKKSNSVDSPSLFVQERVENRRELSPLEVSSPPPEMVSPSSEPCSRRRSARVAGAAPSNFVPIEGAPGENEAPLIGAPPSPINESFPIEPESNAPITAVRRSPRVAGVDPSHFVPLQGAPPLLRPNVNEVEASEQDLANRVIPPMTEDEDAGVVPIVPEAASEGSPEATVPLSRRSPRLGGETASYYVPLDGAPELAALPPPLVFDESSWIVPRRSAVPARVIEVPTIVSPNPFDPLAPTLTSDPISSDNDVPLAPRDLSPRPRLSKPQGKKRTGLRAFGSELASSSLEDTLRSARTGRLFKHRIRVKGPIDFVEAIGTVDDGAELNVVDSVWLESALPILGAVIDNNGATGVRMANNSVQKLVGVTILRIQIGLSEELVPFQVLDSGGSFQVLLGKPWLAQVGAIHFYEVDCLDMRTSIPDRWCRLWNQNPKSTPPFTAVPGHPSALVKYLEEQAFLGVQAPPGDAAARVLLISEVVLDRACRTPLPNDDNLLPIVEGDRYLVDAFGTERCLPSSPQRLRRELILEHWRRSLRGIPRRDLVPDSEGSAFFCAAEIEHAVSAAALRVLPDSAVEFWANVDPSSSSDVWSSSLSAELPEFLPVDFDYDPGSTPMLIGPEISEELVSHLRAGNNSFSTPAGTAFALLPADIASISGGEEFTATSDRVVMLLKSVETVTRQSSKSVRQAELRRLISIGDDKLSFSPEETEEVYALIDEFVDQFAFCLADVRQTGTVKHAIPTDPSAVPTRARQRPINNPDQKQFLLDHIDLLLEANVIRPVSPEEVSWVSHNTVAPKADLSIKSLSPDEIRAKLEESLRDPAPVKHGWREQPQDEFPAETKRKPKFRLCHAFLDLNDATMGASFPVGDLEGKIERLGGKSIFSCFDLHSGYFAIEMRDEDVLKTTFAVEDRGFFAYRVMPFGLKGAPATFCKLIATAFGKELGNGIEAWMDDLATSTDFFKPHLARVRRILEICREHNLSLNPAKCNLFKSGMVWCGSYISKNGREPDKAKVQTLVEWTVPLSPYEVLRFLNFAGFYRPLIKDFAKMTEPLQQLTRGVRVSDASKRKTGKPGPGAYRAALKKIPLDWTWGAEQQTAFDNVKKALTSFPVLRSPDWSLPFVVETDASILGMGAVLAQDFTYEHPESKVVGTHRHPIAFVSRATKDSEKRYSAFLLELVCVKWALEKFHKYIFGRELELVTDCQALAGILSNQKVSAAHARWREFILGHDIVKFTHRPGRLHQACDELSRRAHNLDEPATIPDPTLLPSWEDYLAARDPVSAVDQLSSDPQIPISSFVNDPKVPARPTGLEKLEAQVLFLAEDDAGAALTARFADDNYFAPIVSYLLTLQVDPILSSQEAGRLRQLARSFFISLDGSLRYTSESVLEGRECVPERERASLILEAHQLLNHSGRDRLLAHLYRRYYWPSMSTSISPVLRYCSRCQQFGRRLFRSKLQPVSVLRPMQLLSMDYFSLPEGMGKHKSVLVIVDYFSRFIWAYKFKGEGTGAKTVTALSDLFATFGRPACILSDNGRHLNCAEVNDFCESLGVERRTTPAYEPHTNGLVERANQSLLKALERACAADQIGGTPNLHGWPTALQSVISSLNDRIVSSTASRPSELIFGYRRANGLLPPVDSLLVETFRALHDLRLEVAVELAESESRRDFAFEELLKTQELRKARVDLAHERSWRGASAAQTSSLARGDLVLVHNSRAVNQIGHKLQVDWLGPYRIIARGSDVAPDLSLDDPHRTNVTFWLDDPSTGKAVGGRVHANRLKLAEFPPTAPYEAQFPMPSVVEYFQKWKEPERDEIQDDEETWEIEEEGVDEVPLVVSIVQPAATEPVSAPKSLSTLLLMPSLQSGFSSSAPRKTVSFSLPSDTSPTQSDHPLPSPSLPLHHNRQLPPPPYVRPAASVAPSDSQSQVGSHRYHDTQSQTSNSHFN